jgi:uncharacterized membrane protein YbhN (UPF0104 family)
VGAFATFLGRHKGKLLLSAVITLCIWYTLHKGGLKIVPESGDFQHVRWWVVGPYFLSVAMFNYFRSVRWRYLLRSIAVVRKRRLLAASFIGFAAILIMPFRIGEFVRPYMIRTAPNERQAQGERPITLTAATSSIVAERVIDGLYLSVILAFALLLVPTVHPLPDKVVGIPVAVEYVRRSGFLMLPLFAGLSVATAVFYFARSWAHKTTIAIVGRVSMKFAEKLTHFIEKAVDGLHVLSRGRDALGFFVESTGYWLVNALGMWLLAWGCGVVHADGSAPTFGEACALMGMLGCAILIPGPPGLLGVFQAGLYAGMTMYYPTSVVTGGGAAFVFLLYMTQVVFTLVSAGLALLFEQRTRAWPSELEASDPIVATQMDA